MCVYVCMCMSFACAGAGAVQRRTSNVFFGPFLLNVINLWAHSDLNRLGRKSWGSICPNPHIHTHFCSEVISKNKHTLFSFLVVVFVLFVCFFFFWVLRIQTQVIIFALKSFGQQTISSFPIFLSCDYLILHTPICWRPHFCFCELGSFMRCQLVTCVSMSF